MEVLQYRAPAASFPRYEYSKRHVSRIVEDFGILMKDLKVDVSELSVPEYSDVEIFLTKGKQSNFHVDEKYIELRKPSEVECKGKRTVDNVEDILTINTEEAVNVHPKIIVVSASSVSDIEPFVKFHLNTVIVAEDEQLENQIKANTEQNYKEDNRISVTTTKNLGITICLLLERVVFRNLRDYVYVLKELIAIAKFEPVRRIVVTDAITHLVELFLENDDCFEGWLMEMEGYSKKSVNHKQDKTRFRINHCVKDESEYQKKEILPVPDYLKAFPDVKERYIKGNEDIYYLAYKLSSHVALATEQPLFSGYKKLMPMFRAKERNEMANEYETIRSSTEQYMFKLFISTVPKYTIVGKDDSAADILLGFLRKAKSEIVQGIKRMTENLKFVKMLDRQLALVKNESDTSIVHLLEDIMGMYYRSKVPQFEQPTREQREQIVELNDKVRRRLFKNVKSAKSCGYRYNKLHIYVEETNDTEKEIAHDDINILLKSYNIKEFVVSQVSPVKTLHKVGAAIELEGRKGTLGGFASMGSQNTLCALLSKHVARDAKYVCLVGDRVHIGSMVKARGLQQTNKCVDNSSGQRDEFGDIAAAEILTPMKQKCDILFKDSNRKSLSSKLCQFETTDTLRWLKHLPIHFYGASTVLGQGTITSPSLSFEETDEYPYVIVEGRRGNEDFSKEGDSGAVICADDPDGECVHVISMLVGKYNAAGKNDHTKKQYLTCRMKNGLQHLSKETGKQFTLC